jgi:hypothetical protein
MVGFARGLAATEAGAEETGEVAPETGAEAEGERVGTGVAIALKKGRERLPQPGMLTSQPEEIRSNNKSIAEKMDKLFKVSRNRAFLRNGLALRFSLGFPVKKVNKFNVFEGFRLRGGFQK